MICVATLTMPARHASDAFLVNAESNALHGGLLAISMVLMDVITT